jgi:hypothetical protein
MTGTEWLAAPMVKTTAAATEPPTIAVPEPIRVRKWALVVLPVFGGSGAGALT